MCDSAKNKDNVLNIVANGLNQGLIMVREDGTIGEYSQLAKEIVGLILPEGKSHPEGRINNGDIVIIADNELGIDDMLTPEDLRTINIPDGEIDRGDAFLAMGVYGNKKISPVYKVFKSVFGGSRVELVRQYLGFNIGVSIDFENKRMTVSVNGDEYFMDYLESIAFFVVLDGATGAVKFFQTRGFSYRGEELGMLLRGAPFAGKNIPGQPRDLHPTVGLPASDILYGEKIQKDIRKLMEGENGMLLEGTYDIFRLYVYCRMVRVRTGESHDGVYIFLQDNEMTKHSASSDTSLTAEIEKKSRRSSFKFAAGKDDPFRNFIGNSPAMAVVKQLAYKASKTKFNVIITGESGTGKSRLAREIHNAQNPSGPFVKIACNAIAPSLFESELFGYAPGSFTGASSGGRAGYFEEAKGGTIFLDEIGEIPLDIQVKLLAVLQDKKIYRVGSAKPVDIDVRVITATNRNLEEEVRKGNFRQDLYYRINVFPIEIPPLRERRRDLYVMANSILSDLCEKYELEPKQFSEEALEMISSYSWPGNVRELENIIERAITICDGRLIYTDHLLIGRKGEPLGTGRSLKERLDLEERRILEDTVSRYNGDKRAAMEELGLSKSAFYEKLKKYGIS